MQRKYRTSQSVEYRTTFTPFLSHWLIMLIHRINMSRVVKRLSVPYALRINGAQEVEFKVIGWIIWRLRRYDLLNVSNQFSSSEKDSVEKVLIFGKPSSRWGTKPINVFAWTLYTIRGTTAVQSSDAKIRFSLFVMKDNQT